MVLNVDLTGGAVIVRPRVNEARVSGKVLTWHNNRCSERVGLAPLAGFVHESRMLDLPSALTSEAPQSYALPLPLSRANACNILSVAILKVSSSPETLMEEDATSRRNFPRYCLASRAPRCSRPASKGRKFVVSMQM